MDPKPYTIAVDRDQNLVTIAFAPVFWTGNVSGNFIKDCIGVVTSLPCKPGDHLILVDLHNAVIQSKSVYDKMIVLITSATARRIALIASEPIARMQTKRLQTRDTIVLFEDVSTARTWLFEDRSSAAAA
jgi:hypothetical protein